MRSGLGEPLFSAAWEAGRALPLEEVTVEATALLAAVAAPAANPRGNTVGDLTERETEILRLLVRRLTDKEIADALSISPRTVMNHVASILGKLGVASRREAADWAVRHDPG